MMSLLMPKGLEAQGANNESDVLVVRNRDDHRFWTMDIASGNIAPPEYPKDLMRAGVSGCVSIGFYIEEDGSTSKYRVLKSIVGDSRSGKIGKKDKRAATSMLGNAAVKSLADIRFTPGPRNPTRKRGFFQVPFSFSADVIPLQGSCDIPDLEAFLGRKIFQPPSR